MKGIYALLIVILVFGLAFALFYVNPAGRAGRDVDLPRGTYEIVCLVELEEDYALIVLRREGGEPRYYRIIRKNVLNFEEISGATTIVKVREDHLVYIQFK